MKGVILAGGTGSRLYPLTRITNKHLLPVHDRPMVSYAIEALVRAGVGELMLVTGGTHAGEFFRLLGNGHEHGIERLLYAYQENPGGIAEALGLAERFVDRDRVCVMLADNLLERSFRPSAERFESQERGARVLLSREYDFEHLRHLGVPDLDGDGRPDRDQYRESYPEPAPGQAARRAGPGSGGGRRGRCNLEGLGTIAGRVDLGRRPARVDTGGEGRLAFPVAVPTRLPTPAEDRFDGQ